MFSFWRTHYIGHVYVAMKEWLENHPEHANTTFFLQMTEIRDQAKLAYDEKQRIEDASRMRH